jgi:uncharacterized protein (TIGR02186 family)
MKQKIEMIGTFGRFMLAAVLMLTLSPWSAKAVEGTLQLELSSNVIAISTFYNGTTLEVHGMVPAATDVVIQVSGPRHEVHLKEKGKVAGFLWMNKTDVTLENTPAVYMVYTPGKADLLKPELGVGYKSLLNDIAISPETEDKAFVFGEYVKLMEESGVYVINDSELKYGEKVGGLKRFSATLNIPSKMSAGHYEVKAISIQDGAVLGQVSQGLQLELKGLPALISTMAYGRPLLFGIMAVVIAIGAGLIIGVIFRGGGGAH